MRLTKLDGLVRLVSQHLGTVYWVMCGNTGVPTLSTWESSLCQFPLHETHSQEALKFQSLLNAKARGFSPVHPQPNPLLSGILSTWELKRILWLREKISLQETSGLCHFCQDCSRGSGKSWNQTCFWTEAHFKIEFMNFQITRWQGFSK